MPVPVHIMNPKAQGRNHISKGRKWGRSRELGSQSFYYMPDQIQAMNYSGERLDSKLMTPEEIALVCPASNFWAELYSGEQRTISSQPG